MNKDFDINNFKLTLTQGALKILYHKYKDIIIPLGVIIICIVLFTKVVSVQLQEWFSDQEQIKITRDKIATLNKNLSFITQLNENTINSDLEISVRALPTAKDYAGIISAVTQAAINSGVGLNDYGFAVGDLSTPSAELSVLPNISFSVHITSGLSDAQKFLEALSKTLPLSEVTSVQIEEGASQFNLVYYYRPVSHFDLNYEVPMQNFSVQETSLLNTLHGWSSGISEFQFSVPQQSTSSASP